MATAKSPKKSTKTTKTKRTTASRASAARSPRKTTTTRTTKKRAAAKNASMRSFRLEKQREPFMQTSPTIQSLYWLILGIVVVAFAVWIYTLQAQVQDIYDQIDRVNAESEAVVIPKKTER